MIYKILNLLDCKIPFNHVSAHCAQRNNIDDASTQLNQTHQFPLPFGRRKSVEVYQEKYSRPSVTSLTYPRTRL